MKTFRVFVTGIAGYVTMYAINIEACRAKARQTYGNAVYFVEEETAAYLKQEEYLFDQMRSIGLSPTD
jgi:hypothetical protein